MYIYKFRSNADEYLEDILKSEEFYFNDWEEMNDPLEGFFTYYLEEHTNDEISQIYTDKNEYRICCFSKEYKEILLWSHYANNHKGICIEIEVDEESIGKEGIFLKDIEYEEKLPELLSKEDGKSKDSKILLTKKLKKWEYEEEIRAFYNKSRIEKKRGIKLQIGKITRIICGVRFSEDDEEKLKKSINVPFVKTEIDFETNDIRIKDM